MRKWLRDSAENESQTNRTCWSHYNVNLFCNCIVPLRRLEFGSEHKHSHWESDQWVIPADCSTVTERQGVWLSRCDITPALHDAGSGRPPQGGLCWSNHSRLRWVGLWLNGEHFPEPVYPRVYSLLVCAFKFTLKPPCLHNQLHSTVKFIGQ